MCNKLVMVLMLLLTGCGAACAQANDPHWYAGAGVTLSRVDETAADYRDKTSPTSFRAGQVTFPNLFVGRSFKRAAVETGYRKMGTLHFATADGLTQGNTHSNALYVSGLLPLARLAALTIYARGSLNVVRTITLFKKRAATFPVSGDSNVFQFAPSAGLGVEYRPGEKWSGRLDADAMPVRLGETSRSGRYHQTTVGLSIVRHF